MTTPTLGDYVIALDRQVGELIEAVYAPNPDLSKIARLASQVEARVMFFVRTWGTSDLCP